MNYLPILHEDTTAVSSEDFDSQDKEEDRDDFVLMPVLPNRDVLQNYKDK